MIRRLAPHVRLALVTGETGTGKELVARALHSIGPRRDRRFIAVNCSAVNDTLFESELFGHVRGGFLGATENKPGLFELADGGTLFLDEIGGLPLDRRRRSCCACSSSAKSTGSARSTRGAWTSTCIAATNRDLRAEVAAGRFRGDLYYRLNVVEVRLPPLRDRREDIPVPDRAPSCAKSRERLQKPLRGLTPGAEALLTESPWDGNVRELRNVVERACILADGEFVTERELALSACRRRVAAAGAPRRAGSRGAAGQAGDAICWSTSNAITSSARSCAPAATRRPRRRCSV